MKEIAGIVRFAARERFGASPGRSGSSSLGPGPEWHALSSELRWAWRGIRARRWRAVFSIALLAVALAAAATMFSVADALLYTKAPFRNVERLVAAEPARPGLAQEWRDDAGVFRDVHLYALDGVLSGVTESPFDGSASVTPGLIDMLGGVPRFGRMFVAEDGQSSPPGVALISEDFASRRFADPAAAVGRTVQTTGGPVTIVGVMPVTFRFPHGRIRLWRPLDPDRPPPPRAVALARLADDLPLAVAQDIVRSRESAGPSVEGGRRSELQVQAFESQFAGSGYYAQIFPWLLGAAVALLVSACLNVAGLELAWALRGRRTRAVQLALGMPRALLVRSVLCEALLLAVAAGLAGAGLAWLAADAVRWLLPEVYTYSSANRIDLDGRALAFMAICSAPAWVLPAIPVLAIGLRETAGAGLKDDPRSLVTTRCGEVSRRAMTAGQIALAVALVIGAVLTLRTYDWLAYRDRGFEGAGLVRLSASLPRDVYPDDAAVRAAALELEAALRAMPVVTAFSRVSDLPPYAGWSAVTRVQIEGEASADRAALSWYEVAPAFGEVLPVRIIAGRFLLPSDPPEAIVVGERFAARYWPNSDAVGRRFRRGTGPWREVVGVAGTVRHRWSSQFKVADPYLEMYEPIGPPAAATQAGRPATLTFALRLASERRLPDVIASAAGLDSRLKVEAQTVDWLYSWLFEDRRLAASVLAVFAALAVLVTLSGIYGLMVFMVADRRREIGLRVALGAARRDIGRLIIGSLARLVVVGGAIGVAVSYVSARLLESQLYGVTPADPASYMAAALVTAAMAVLASWPAVRQALRVDPAITLRAE